MHLIILQLRTNSARMHRKIYRNIEGKEMWERIYLTALSTGHKVVMAIPKWDEQLNYVSNRVKGAYNWCTGDEEDVLQRFKTVASKHDLITSDKIVRITGDCPLLTKEAILSTIYGAEGKEYHYSGIDGFDVEVFTVRALMEADKNTEGEDRQHVTKYLKEKYMPWTDTIPHMLSVDTEEDLELIKKVING